MVSIVSTRFPWFPWFVFHIEPLFTFDNEPSEYSYSHALLEIQKPARTRTKTTDRPEIGSALSSIFMFIVVSFCWKHGICHMFISRWCLLARHFQQDLWKILLLLQWGLKIACWTPSKNVTFFWMVLRFATAPAILFHHFNLRTVFAVISHASAFQCMHRHCHEV